jgi:hypothetical protein
VGRFGVSGDRDSVGHRSTAREPPWLGVGGHLVITEARTKLVERTPAAAQFLPSGTFFVVVPEIHPVLIAIVQHPLVVFRRRACWAADEFALQSATNSPKVVAQGALAGLDKRRWVEGDHGGGERAYQEL